MVVDISIFRMLPLDEEARLDMLGERCVDNVLAKLLLLSSLSTASPEMAAESREAHCEHNVIPGVWDEADEEVAPLFGKVCS